jgi:hypothetical protein
MVNREELVTKLEVYGNVQFCDVNTEDTYLIVMSDWTGTIDNFVDIVSVEVIPTYERTVALTLVEGVIKSEFDKVE